MATQDNRELIAPPANRLAWMWVILLGLPAMMLFLVLEKQQFKTLYGDEPHPSQWVAPAEHP